MTDAPAPAESVADPVGDPPRLTWAGLVAELAIPWHGAGEAGRLWVAGSVVLTRAVCRCAARIVVHGWRSLRTGSNAAPVHEALAVATLVTVLGGTVAVGALGGVLYLARPYLPVIVPCAGAVWTVAAWMVAPRPEPPEDTPQELDEYEPIDPGEKPQDAAAADAEAVLYIEHLVAIARTRARNGVHLADILPGVQVHRPEAAVQDLRANLERLGVPVRNQLKIGRANRAGIHFEDLAKKLGHRPRLPAHLVPDLTPAQADAEPTSRAAQSDPAGVPLAVSAGALRHLAAGPSQAPAGTPDRGSA